MSFANSAKGVMALVIQTCEYNHKNLVPTCIKGIKPACNCCKLLEDIHEINKHTKSKPRNKSLIYYPKQTHFEIRCCNNHVTVIDINAPIRCIVCSSLEILSIDYPHIYISKQFTILSEHSKIRVMCSVPHDRRSYCGAEFYTTPYLMKTIGTIGTTKINKNTPSVFDCSSHDIDSYTNIFIRNTISIILLLEIFFRSPFDECVVGIPWQYSPIKYNHLAAEYHIEFTAYSRAFALACIYEGDRAAFPHLECARKYCNESGITLIYIPKNSACLSGGNEESSPDEYNERQSPDNSCASIQRYLLEKLHALGKLKSFTVNSAMEFINSEIQELKSTKRMFPKRFLIDSDGQLRSINAKK